MPLVMVKTLKAKEFRTCIRFSDLESIETLKLVVEKQGNHRI